MTTTREQLTTVWAAAGSRSPAAGLLCGGIGLPNGLDSREGDENDAESVDLGKQAMQLSLVNHFAAQGGGAIS
jgi:hypothetical protein